jgi:AbiV family abortive infection protein
VDLTAVKAATGPELAAGAAAAAKNADSLLRDAEVLAGAGRAARAYSLAALAVEEVGKAVSLGALGIMPEAMRAQAPVGRMLEWHQLKQAVGQLIAVVPSDPPGLAGKLLAGPEADLARILSALEVPAEEADRLKRSGLYLDISRGGRIREPSEITETEVTRQLARARRAVSSARTLLEPNEQARLVHPCAEGVELARSAVSAVAKAGCARTPDAAADVIINMVSKLREQIPADPTAAHRDA